MTKSYPLVWLSRFVAVEITKRAESASVLDNDILTASELLNRQLPPMPDIKELLLGEGRPIAIRVNSDNRASVGNVSACYGVPISYADDVALDKFEVCFDDCW
jgi:hypothetical protein